MTEKVPDRCASCGHEPCVEWMQCGGDTLPCPRCGAPNLGRGPIPSETDDERTARQQLATTEMRLANLREHVADLQRQADEARHELDLTETQLATATAEVERLRVELTEKCEQCDASIALEAEVERLRAREAEVLRMVDAVDYLRIRALLSSDGGTGR